MTEYLVQILLMFMEKLEKIRGEKNQAQQNQQVTIHLQLHSQLSVTCSLFKYSELQIKTNTQIPK